MLEEHLTSQEASERWATRLRRHCGERRTLERLTDERGSSSWAPPQARDGKGAFKDHTKGGRDLSNDAELWPTSTATDAKSSARHGYMIEGNAGTTLLDAVRAWPTPTTSDVLRGSGTYMRGNQTLKGEGSSQNGINGKGGENERPSAGTPSLSTACRTGALPGGKGVLNPYFVEALMGWPQGWTNPDEPVGDHAPFPPPPRDAEGWAAYLERWPSAVPAVQREDPRTRLRIDRLRACGNGVVPQQAEEAYCELFEALSVGGEWVRV